jgi:acyl carrier protein phosphodiesterase
MISDCIKGRAQYQYPEGIQKGIRLHRAIDAFTDSHPATKRAQEVFRPHYRLYSAPLADVAFDYFLANDKETFNEATLFHFSQHTYAVIESFDAHLPPRFATLFTYMKRDNWLFRYRSMEGIGNSLRGLMYRASMPDDGQHAGDLLLQHKSLLQQCFDDFFPDVKKFAKGQVAELLE